MKTVFISVFNQLLKKSAKERLGCEQGRLGAFEIKRQSFFRNVNWKRLEAGMCQPPFTPDVSLTYITQYKFFVSENQYKLLRKTNIKNKD